MATARPSNVRAELVEDPVRQKIVTSARAHFFQHGFRGVTMDDLAAGMAMSKKTLYVHFPSKRTLLDAAIEQKFESIEAEMDSIGTQIPKDFGDTLHRLLDCMRRHTQEISPTFVRDVAKDDPRLITQIKERRRHLISRTFGRILKIGQKEGAIRKDISAELLVEILIGIADSVATPESLALKRRGPGDVLPSILSVFLEGALVRKSR